MNRNKMLSRIFNALGLGLILLISAAVLPLALPKLLGIQVYGVLTGSMEPEYSVGGVVYVQECDTAALQLGDVITYTLGTADSVMTHRIVGIDEQSGDLLTKGDANAAVDAGSVGRERVIGRVVWYLPYMAYLAGLLQTTEGILLVASLLLFAVILWMLSDIIKRAKRDMLRPVGRAAAVLLMAGAGCYLGMTYLDGRSSAAEYEALAQQVFEDRSEWVETAAEGISEDEIVQHAVAELQEMNPDTVGWIKFENPQISYPVMHAQDNDYYLRRSFSGERKTAGSIFVDAINHGDFQDAHTIIYGHNMRNLSMFGQLKYYKDEAFYEGNEYFTITTDSDTYRYQIFSYYDVPENSDVYTIWYTSDENFEVAVAQMQKKAYYNTGVVVTAEDKIITLSTCSTEGNRFVIHAKRVGEQERAENE